MLFLKVPAVSKDLKGFKNEWRESKDLVRKKYNLTFQIISYFLK
jgi:hypothetical protein